VCHWPGQCRIEGANVDLSKSLPTCFLAKVGPSNNLIATLGSDFEAFEKVLIQAVARTKTRLLAYCVLPNHWHLVVWPRGDGELSRFVGWLTLTHTQRWHAQRRSAGAGHLYQGRFKSFPIQEDEHLFTVARYVERNALRAKLVEQAEEWQWCSLYRWRRGSAEERR
jgi:putative transposase